MPTRLLSFDTDAGKMVINWPDQNYKNGLAKHERTGRRYRKVVRMLKRLRDLMQVEQAAAAKGIASCLIEALVWNVPDEQFAYPTYQQDLRAAMAYCFNNTMNDEGSTKWVEVNERKYLFRPSQPWTRGQAHVFLDAAWDRVGFD